MDRLKTIFGDKELRDALREAEAQLDPALVKRGAIYSIDDRTPVRRPTGPITKYRIHQYEHLLDQSADLLDRGLRDRQLWNEVFEKWFTNAIALQDLTKQVAIERDEEEARGLEQLAIASQSELEAAAARIPFLVSAERHIDEITVNQLNPSSRNEIIQREGALAQFGTIDRSNRQDIVPVNPHFPGDVGSDVMQIRARRATEFLAAKRVEVDFLGAIGKREQVRSELAATRASIGEGSSGLTAKAAYDKKDIEFRKRRRVVARETLAMKLLATVLKGGPLNFQEQMEPIRNRYNDDFQHALERLDAAAEGLKGLLGYVDPIPSLSADHPEAFIDDCVNWVRRAINFVVQSGQLDQTQTVSLSLAQVTGNFSSGRSNGLWRFNLVREGIPLGRKLFHVRLRGISAFAIGSQGLATWSLAIQAPRTAECHHTDGSTKVVDQSAMGPVLVGRVTSRNSSREPEVAGAPSHQNLSPFGEWTVTAPKASLEGVEIGNLDDIHIDLHLAARVLP
jgi:hypothetical protein